MKVKTLTPLWTGGVGGKVDRIHETGLLGSMRWWYEVLVRGLGGRVCERSDECKFDVDKYFKSEASDECKRLRDTGLRDVCQIFGATGWKRRFRLSVKESEIYDAIIQHPIEAERVYETQGKKHTPAWCFPSFPNTKPNTPKSGSFEIQIQSLYGDFPSDVIMGLIQFIADWGVLGARAQMGFGVIEPIDDRWDTGPLYKWLVATADNQEYCEWPSLRNVFFTQIKMQNVREVDTFNLKYDLRQLFSANQDVRHFIMGTTAGDNKMAAKVKISRPYGDGQIRIWGWIPEKAGCYDNEWNREKIVEVIHNHLIHEYDLETWREFNSPRDTATVNITDPREFLQSLLGIEGG